MPSDAEDSRTLYLKRLAATHNSWLPENYEDALRALEYLRDMVERDWPRQPNHGRGAADLAKVVSLVATVVNGP
jgi:hypothetical protein